MIPITRACRLTVMTPGNPNWQEKICGIAIFSKPAIIGVWWSVTMLHLMHSKYREPRAGSKKRGRRDWEVLDVESIYLTSWNCSAGLTHPPCGLKKSYLVLRGTQNCNHTQILHSLFCNMLQVILKPLLISRAWIHFYIKDLRRKKRPEHTRICYSYTLGEENYHNIYE